MSTNSITTEDTGNEKTLLLQQQETFIPYDSSAMSLTELLGYMLGNIEGISIDGASLNYIGTDSATSYFEPLELGAGLSLDHSGILLTSGDGTPARSNTEEGYSVDHSQGEWVEYDEPKKIVYDSVDEAGNPITVEEWEEGYWEAIDNGDAQMTEIAQNAFEGAGETHDAAVLEFAFSVTDSSIRSISVDLMFGSEEYPNYIDSPFVDIAAVIVNGENHAYIDGDITKPLSIVGATTEDGRFIDNDIWHDTSNGDPIPIEPTAEAPLNIEYNGITPKLTISIPLQEDEDSYQVRIGVADTGDGILDSGLFVSNLQALTSNYEGTLVNVKADDQGNTLEAAAPDTATMFVGGKGNDTMKGSTAADVYDLQQGGANTIQGQLANLDQDTVVGFSEQDTLVVDDSSFTDDQLEVTMGSAILDIDSNSDGTANGTVTLEGDFRHSVFRTESTDAGGTEVRVHTLDLTPDQTQWAGTDDIRVDSEGMTRLLGDTAGTQVTIAQGSSAINLSAGTDVVLEGMARDDIQLLRDGTTLMVVNDQADVLVQLATSTQEGLVSELTLSDGTFSLGASADLEALSMSASGDDTLDELLFEGDGDRLMGSQWPDTNIEAAALVGVPPTDTELAI